MCLYLLYYFLSRAQTQARRSRSSATSPSTASRSWAGCPAALAPRRPVIYIDKIIMYEHIRYIRYI